MKFKTDKYTVKWIKLAIIVIVSFIISYLFAFSNTFDLYKQSSNNKTNIIELKEKPLILKKLEKKVIENEESMIKVSGLDSLTSRQKMLDLFASATGKFLFSVKEVSPSYISSIDSTNYELSIYTLEGSFLELLKTWNYIEKQIHFGKIYSSRFYISEDYRLNLKKLNLILYVELFKNKKK